MGRMKDGNKKVRWILIEAANTASRTVGRLRNLYLRLAKRHGRHIAVTHVANKICTIIWHMLTYKKLYNERKIGLHLTNTINNSNNCISPPLNIRKADPPHNGGNHQKHMQIK